MLKKPSTCWGCPAFEAGQGYVPGEGVPHSRIALVGQGPGKTEAHLGQPFVGPSGNMLDRWLREAQLSRSECWVDNVVRCWLPNNRAPRKAEVEYCTRQHLTHALHHLKDLKVVVPVGVVAAKHFLGPDATESAVGAIAKRDI